MMPPTMVTEDANQERQRLITLYAAMSEGELQEVADDVGSLSDIAVQALAEEVQRRGLDIALADFAVPFDKVEQRELVTIGDFRDLPQALLAKGKLESAGIECFLGDDNMVRMEWYISNLLGGIKLRVHNTDAEEALNLLKEPIPETFEVEGVGQYEQPRCPRCGSLDISHELGVDKRVALPALWALAGLPVPVPRNVWKCASCGAEWQNIKADESGTEADSTDD